MFTLAVYVFVFLLVLVIADAIVSYVSDKMFNAAQSIDTIMEEELK